ncbi:MAG: hypothetical protein Q7K54_00840 [Candidatus Parcubacteria bacterium]|nr:hypothetical protein [Candidatus Parcubacteria bacterium]
MKINFWKKEKSLQKKSFIYYIKLYWDIAVLVVLISSVASFSFGYYLFNQINKEMVVSMNDVAWQDNLVTKDRISKTLEYFSLREQKSSQIIYSASPVVDPSL